MLKLSTGWDPVIIRNKCVLIYLSVYTSAPHFLACISRVRTCKEYKIWVLYPKKAWNIICILIYFFCQQGVGIEKSFYECTAMTGSNFCTFSFSWWPPPTVDSIPWSSRESFQGGLDSFHWAGVAMKNWNFDQLYTFQKVFGCPPPPPPFVAISKISSLRLNN